MRKRYIILAGIYVDERKPILNSFLAPIVEELRFFHETGIVWKPDGVENITSKFVTTTCVVDSVARYEILNMRSFLGIFGCTFCYAKGQRLPTSNNRIYRVRNYRYRTDIEMRRHMRSAMITREPKFGIEGASILQSLPMFHLRKSMVVDAMHNADLGVAKQMFHLIFFSAATLVWYHGSPAILSLIDERMKKIRTPSRIARKPRSMNTYKTWKASEWRNWILYYAVSCLTGIIGNEYLSLFCKLSEALHILNGDSINREEMDRAKILIEQFVAEYQTIFGCENMTYNVHILRHLCDTVENWGPIWCNSAFIYESYNRKIAEAVNSPTGRPLQIMNKYLLNDFMRCVIHDPTMAEEMRSQIISILNYGRKAPFRIKFNLHEHENFEGLGTFVSRELTDCERRILNSIRLTCRGRINVFKKCVIKGNMYTCGSVEQDDTRESNKNIYTKENHFAEILSFVKFVNHEEQAINGMFVTFYETVGNLGETRHIKVLNHSNQRGFVIEDDLKAPAIIMNLTNEATYGVRMTNVWETD
ncbi:uncharacterized protein [Venturia canescens]|uniref:uncharacterized protein n=1 Tax=Venturia canescens TaxID=32260 RepID=UPI001C9C7409|nr:uncharacterized protein LOC122408894 [Venturia canescens]